MLNEEMQQKHNENVRNLRISEANLVKLEKDIGSLIDQANTMPFNDQVTEIKAINEQLDRILNLTNLYALNEIIFQEEARYNG
jgi:hypothetical protein